MQPRRSFVPKVDFGTLAKKYKLGDNPVQDNDDPPKEQALVLQSEQSNSQKKQSFTQMRQQSQTKMNANNVSVGEMEMNFDMFPSDKKKPTQKTILHTQFQCDGRPELSLESIQNEEINNQYLKACEIIYQIEVERMKVFYKEHPKFIEVIESYSQRMREFFGKEINLKSECLQRQTFHIQQKQVEICKINAQISEYERLTNLTDEAIKQVDYSLLNFDDLQIMDQLRQRLDQIFYLKQSKDLLTSLVEDKLVTINKISSQMLKSAALKKEEQIQEKATLYHKIEKQNQVLRQQINDIEVQFGSYFEDTDFDINMIFNNSN